MIGRILFGLFAVAILLGAVHGTSWGERAPRGPWLTEPILMDADPDDVGGRASLTGSTDPELMFQKRDAQVLDTSSETDTERSAIQPGTSLVVKVWWTFLSTMSL